MASVTAAAASSPGSISTSSASSPTQSSSLDVPYFESNWNILPIFSVGDIAQDVLWQIPELPSSTGPHFSPTLIVCQTNASILTQMDSTNTWSVDKVPFNICSECIIGDGSVQTSTVQFLSTSGYTATSEDVFFFCISNSSLPIDEIVCDSFGPTFSMKTATAAARRERRTLVERQVPNVTPITYMPTTPLSITQYTPVVGISGVLVKTIQVFATANDSSTTWTTISPIQTATSAPIAQLAPQSGLSTTAKAVISIVVILVFFVLLIAMFIFLRHRKQRMHYRNAKFVPPNTHELITNANSHELFTKHNVPELEEQNNGILKEKQKVVQDVRTVAKTCPAAEVFELGGKLTVVQELDPKSRSTALNFEEYLLSPHELETSETAALPQLVPLADPLQVLTRQEALYQGKDVPPPANDERERKVELLTNRMDRIREEKERLERIQELKDLEEQTKREILDAWKEDRKRS